MIVIAGALILAGVIVFFVLYYKKRMLEEELKRKELEKDSADKMLRMVFESLELERKRISKELHDGLGVLLQALRATLHTVVKDVDENDKKEVQEIVDELTDTVRSISWDLMPTTLERFGLVNAVEEFCKRLCTKVEVSISFVQEGQPLPLDMNQQLLLYRIIQEAVNNALKHAHASSINVMMKWQEGNLFLSITDNGIGFDYSSQLKFTKTSGLGLTNLESRSHLLNAELTFARNNPSGTIVNLKLPVYVG